MASVTEVSYTCDRCGEPARHIGVALQVGESKKKPDLCGPCRQLFDKFKALIDEIPVIRSSSRG